jgi:hypothetical protein
MKLLIERIEEVQYLVEEVNGKKVMHIEGVFLQAERKNRNGRVYPKSILEREVSRYVKDKVDRNCAWGELGHPDSPTINLDRTSHRIISLKEDGNNWVGKARIQDTPHGRIVKALIEDGGQLGVSSRGCGTLKMCEGTNMVQDDYHLATGADVVADPSAPDAFVNGLMEQKEWIWNNGLIEEKEIARIYQEVKAAHRRDLEESTIRAFESFIKKL